MLIFYSINTFWNWLGASKLRCSTDANTFAVLCCCRAKGQEPCANQWPVHDELVTPATQQPIIRYYSMMKDNLQLGTENSPPWWVPLPKSPWPQYSHPNKPNPRKDKLITIYSNKNTCNICQFTHGIFFPCHSFSRCGSWRIRAVDTASQKKPSATKPPDFSDTFCFTRTTAPPKNES